MYSDYNLGELPRVSHKQRARRLQAQDLHQSTTQTLWLTAGYLLLRLTLIFPSIGKKEWNPRRSSKKLKTLPPSSFHFQHHPVSVSSTTCWLQAVYLPALFGGTRSRSRREFSRERSRCHSTSSWRGSCDALCSVRDQRSTSCFRTSSDRILVFCVKCFRKL